MARIDPSYPLNYGDGIRLALNRDALYLFDAETEQSFLQKEIIADAVGV